MPGGQGANCPPALGPSGHEETGLILPTFDGRARRHRQGTVGIGHVTAARQATAVDPAIGDDTTIDRAAIDVGHTGENLLRLGQALIPIRLQLLHGGVRIVVALGKPGAPAERQKAEGDDPTSRFHSLSPRCHDLSDPPCLA